MTFEQQLRDQLVRAGRLGADRRGPRSFRALVALPAIVVVVAIGALALMVLPRSPQRSATGTHRAASTERPAGIAPSLYDNFAVLRRPRTPADELPARSRLRTRSRLRGTSEQSRLVSKRYGIRAWMIPGTKDVCLSIKAPTGWGSEGCGKVEGSATYQAGLRPIGSVMVGPMSWRPHRRLVTLLFPDGTSDVQLRRGTRVTARLAVENNAIQVRPMFATSIWWRAPDGTERHLRFH